MYYKELAVFKKIVTGLLLIIDNKKYFKENVLVYNKIHKLNICRNINKNVQTPKLSIFFTFFFRKLV